MKNLDQIRAAHALTAGEKLDKSYVDRVPSMIVNNGLLATAAFAATENQKKRIGPVIEVVAQYLKSRGMTTAEESADLCRDLANKSSEQLRLATDEALAYLSFLKRFAKKKSQGGE